MITTGTLQHVERCECRIRTFSIRGDTLGPWWTGAGHEQLAEPTSASADGDAELVARQVGLALAWRWLSAVHQEAPALAVPDELPTLQAAAALGISPVAFRLRLRRARQALRKLLDRRPSAPGPGALEKAYLMAGLSAADSAREGESCWGQQRTAGRDYAEELAAAPAPARATSSRPGWAPARSTAMSSRSPPGLAGADVGEISYLSPSRGRGTASVASGQFALFLPGDDLERAGSGVALDVTYRDGSIGRVIVAL